MRISISERHAALPDNIKDYAKEKAARLQRYYDRISAIEVKLDAAKNQCHVEMIVRVDGADDFIASENNGDFFAGIDLVVEKLERQITKHKEILRNRKHGSRNPDKTP